MFFFFVCGTQDFSSSLKGYENVLVVCPRCHNNAVSARKRRVFFTFCFVPLVPVSWRKELRCGICGYAQETSDEQLNGMIAQSQQQQQAMPQYK